MKQLLFLFTLIVFPSVVSARDVSIKYGVNFVDINNDSKDDLIIKGRVNIGNAHNYDKYTFLINSKDKFYEITLNTFKTIEGADCVLQNYKFVDDNGIFKIIEFTRELGDSYYSTQTVYKKKYEYRYNKDYVPGENPYEFKLISKEKLDKKYCDVNKLL